MAEESEARATESAQARIDPGAATLAFNAASREEADAFLRKQQRLTDLQIAELEHELALRHWSLRFGNLSAVMKASFEISLAFVMVAIAVFLATAVWNAAHDDTLVIEAFSVPQDFTARGLTGQVVAAQLQDKLATMQDATDTARPAASYANDWGGDIKVEIPDTGVSIGEAYRYLASWLGHRTRITGEVWHDGDGAIAITARVGSDSATVTGREADFPALMQKAAEAVYLHTQPYRYASYIEEKDNNYAFAALIFRRLAVEGDTALERAWAQHGWAMTELAAADVPAALAHERVAVGLMPTFALGWDDVKWFEVVLGHEENSLHAAREAVRLMGGTGDVDMTARARTLTMVLDRGDAESDVGDFDAALSDYRAASHLPEYSGEAEDGRESAVVTLARLHDPRAARAAWQALPAAADADSQGSRTGQLLVLDVDLADWAAALSPRAAAEAALLRSPFRHQAPQLLWPYVAIAMAHTGAISGAEALIGRTPLDCDLCLRTRGKIAALKHDWAAAAHWFVLATRRAPSVPFANSDWGRMLLTKGDLDGAIAKFAAARAISPHFADPLEMWGEALMQKNRSDLALAKFEEADKYAPNWGHLHLEWGEALGYAGKRDEAVKQFAIAGTLDLSGADKIALTRWTGPHG